MGKATELFKEFGLTQEQAQKLIDFHVGELTRAEEAPEKYWKDMKAEWTKELKADKDIGHKLPQVKAEIGRAIALLPADVRGPFQKAMDLTGAGDHPAFIKAFAKFAELLIEGGHVSGEKPSPLGQRQPGAASGTGAKALYPNLS